jgi:protein transport protein SEC23
VGLITFGTHVHVHELGFSECSKCYVFRGSKEYTTQQVVDQLGLRPVAARPGAPGAAPQQPPAKQFILPLADPNCDTAINNVLTDLQRDAYPVPPSMRPARCTGTALQVGGGDGAQGRGQQLGQVERQEQGGSGGLEGEGIKQVSASAEQLQLQQQPLGLC